MNQTTQLSPMVGAIDLMRVNIDALPLDALQAHASQVLDTIGALNSYINSPSPKSSNALRNAMWLVRKLVLHMARVRDLIAAHAAPTVVIASTQSAGAATLSLGLPHHGP